MRSHHDQACRLFVREGENTICGHAHADHAFRINSILVMTFQEIAQLFFAFREESLAKLAINIRRRHKRRIRVSPQLDHMLNEQPGPILLSQRRRISVGPDRELREINRAEDTFNFDRAMVCQSPVMRWSDEQPRACRFATLPIGRLDRQNAWQFHVYCQPPPSAR